MTEAKEIPLGSLVRDIYTGFEGTLVAHTVWLHGCDRLTIEPRTVNSLGNLPDPITFDIDRVELIRVEPVRQAKTEEPAPARAVKTGGPNGPAPSRSAAPR